jgi:hypothetical protein
MEELTMTALMSILEELSEQMDDGDGVELGRGSMLRGLSGARVRQEYRREHREEVIEKLFSLSSSAWIELLSDKVKQEIERTQGEQLNKLAKVIAVSGTQRMTNVLDLLHKKEEFKEQVYQQFAQTKR